MSLAAAVAVAALAGVAHAQCSPSGTPPPYAYNSWYADALNATNPEELRKALHTSVTQKDIKYSYKCVWDIVEEADEDPANAFNVILVYSGTSMSKSRRDNGTVEEAFNREHVWPKSKGFPKESDRAYTDAHALRACDKRVNTDRSDKDFAYGGTPGCLEPWDADVADCEQVYYSTSSTFEVPLFDRGDVARAMFFMDLRYSDSDLDLDLVNESTYRGDKPELGFLCDLFQWHLEDPVSAEERLRNEVVFKWQHNRNPFIDNPAWVDELWEDVACEDVGAINMID